MQDTAVTPAKAYLQGVQHIGVSVDDLALAKAFYIDVLGGKPVLAGDGFEGDAIHNTLFQKEELDAAGNPEKMTALGVPDLREGKQILDVQFVQFPNVVIELLHYHDKDPQENGFDPQRDKTSPAVCGAMHISFHVKDDVDMVEMVKRIETEAHERGMERVKFNRIVRVHSEEERQNASPDAYVNAIAGEDAGDFDGWALAYGKGPFGEQLEFNQVLGRAKRVFDR